MKYFYTDLQAAAWMAKKFGVVYKELDFTFSVDDYGISAFIPRVYHVHPYCEHLFEPRVATVTGTRDLVLDTQGNFRFHESNSSYTVKEIIQRNGISFMWPEIEK